jgi:hypothetical protein
MTLYDSDLIRRRGACRRRSVEQGRGPRADGPRWRPRIDGIGTGPGRARGRRGDAAPPRRPGQPRQLIPAAGADFVDPPYEQGTRAGMSLIASEAEQPTVPGVADPGVGLQARRVERGEDDLGETRRLGRVPRDRQLGTVVQDLVGRVGRVPDRGRDDPRCRPARSGPRPGWRRSRPGRRRGGAARPCRRGPRPGREALAVGRGQRAGRPGGDSWAGGVRSS